MIFVLCVALFVFAAYIPNVILKSTVDTTLGVFLLLAAVLFTLRIDPVLSLAVFLAAGALFLENRKRIVMRLNRPKMDSNPSNLENQASVASQSVDAPDLVDGEVHPDREEPSVDEHSFEPKEDATNEFNPVGESINEKQPLEGAITNSSKAVAEHLTRTGVVD